MTKAEHELGPAAPIGGPLHGGSDRNDLSVRREQPIESLTVPLVEGLNGRPESSNVLI
jgi:hypothetical protein